MSSWRAAWPRFLGDGHTHDGTVPFAAAGVAAAVAAAATLAATIAAAAAATGAAATYAAEAFATVAINVQDQVSPLQSFLGHVAHLGHSMRGLSPHACQHQPSSQAPTRCASLVEHIPHADATSRRLFVGGRRDQRRA